MFNRIRNFVAIFSINGYKNLAACWMATGEEAWDWPVLAPSPDGVVDVLHDTALAGSLAAACGDSTRGWKLWTPRGCVKWPHGRF